MKPLTTDLLLTEKPTKWKESYGEYSRIGLILENYSLEDKINYLKEIGLKTWLERNLEKEITEHIIMLGRYDEEYKQKLKSRKLY